MSGGQLFLGHNVQLTIYRDDKIFCDTGAIVEGYLMQMHVQLCGYHWFAQDMLVGLYICKSSITRLSQRIVDVIPCMLRRHNT